MEAPTTVSTVLVVYSGIVFGNDRDEVQRVSYIICRSPKINYSRIFSFLFHFLLFTDHFSPYHHVLFNMCVVLVHIVALSLQVRAISRSLLVPL